jgi:hypothetical protein
MQPSVLSAAVWVVTRDGGQTLTQRNPRQRPRAEGGRPWRYELRHNFAGPIQLPPRSLRTRVGFRFTGFASFESAR